MFFLSISHFLIGVPEDKDLQDRRSDRFCCQTYSRESGTPKYPMIPFGLGSVQNGGKFSTYCVSRNEKIDGKEAQFHERYLKKPEL